MAIGFNKQKGREATISAIQNKISGRHATEYLALHGVTVKVKERQVFFRGFDDNVT